MTNNFKPGGKIKDFPKNSPKNGKYTCIKNFKKIFRNGQEVFILVTEFDPIGRKYGIEIRNISFDEKNYKNNFRRTFFMKKNDLDFYFRFIGEIKDGE